MQPGGRGGWEHASAEGAVREGVPHQCRPAHPHQPAGHTQRPGLQGKVSADTEVTAQPAPPLLLLHRRLAYVTAAESALDSYGLVGHACSKFKLC